MLRSRDPLVLEAGVESLGYDCPDAQWAERRLLRLAQHPDERMRGMAVVALGNLVARASTGVSPAALDAIRRAKEDSADLVRTLANYAETLPG